jgi:putative two-component system response regulator
MHAERCPTATAVALERCARERAAAQAQHTLERDLHDQVVALRRSHKNAEQELGQVIELRDYDTAAHVVRVGELSARLAAAAGLDAAYCARLQAAAPLHDIGKLAVPDTILLKPGPLSNAEWEIMRAHAEIGWGVLRHSSSATVRLAAVIAYTHHERWDGAGYPRGLADDAIPLPGRLVAVCDAFDALTNVRPYRPALTHDAALDRMLDSPGQFDPRLLALFSDGATSYPSQEARVRAGRAPRR